MRNFCRLVVLFLFYIIPAYAELPFTALKGLDEATVQEMFSPLHGYNAYYGKVIENIRFYGNYGALVSTDDLADAWKSYKDEIAACNARAALWIHPSFLVKEDDSDDVKKMKQHEYPFDPVAALVQWFFPSPTRTVLVCNQRKNDVVGDLARSVLQKQQMLKVVVDFVLSLFRNKLDGLEQNFKEQMIDALSADEIYRFQKKNQDWFEKELAGTKKEDVHRKFKDQADEKNKHDFARIREKMKQKKEVMCFIDILYNSLTSLSRRVSKDHNFMYQNFNKMYHQYIALEIFLAFLWVSCKDKNELLDVYIGAGLIDPSEKENLQAQMYTKEDFLFFKSKMVGTDISRLNKEQRSFVGYGVEIYEKKYPKNISYGSVAIELNGHKEVYADCNETALRNFISLFLYYGSEQKTFDSTRLSFLSRSEKIKQIEQFFIDFPTIEMQQKPLAHQSWANILVDLNKGRHGADIDKIFYKNECYNISYIKLGIASILNIFARLTEDEGLSTPWPSSDISSESFLQAVAFKLDLLCALLTRILPVGNSVSWKQSSGNKVVDDLWASYIFTINNKDICKFTHASVGSGHVDCEFISQNEDVWKQGFTPDDGSKIFFNKFPIACVSDLPLDLEAILPFQSERAHLVESSPLLLMRLMVRTILVTYFSIRHDSYTQYMVYRMLFQLFLPDMIVLKPTHNLTTHPVLIDFLKVIDPALVYYNTGSYSFFKKYNLGGRNINMQEIVNLTTILMMLVQDLPTIPLNERLSCLDYVLSFSPDVNVQDIHGRTVFFYAWRNKDTFEKLSKLEPNFNILTHQGKNILMYVCSRDFIVYHFDYIYPMVLVKNIDINQQDIDGNTVLMILLANTKCPYDVKQKVFLRLLQNEELDVFLENKEKHNALFYAQNIGDAMIIDAIKSRMHEQTLQINEKVVHDLDSFSAENGYKKISTVYIEHVKNIKFKKMFIPMLLEKILASYDSCVIEDLNIFEKIIDENIC